MNTTIKESPWTGTLGASGHKAVGHRITIGNQPPLECVALPAGSGSANTSLSSSGWRGQAGPGRHLCTANPIGVITTDDGAEVWFEGRGYGLRGANPFTPHEMNEIPMILVATYP